MDKIKIKVDEINSLISTDEKPFHLFVELFDYCKQHDCLDVLAVQDVKLRVITGMKHVSIQLKSLMYLLELYQLSQNLYYYYETAWRIGALYSQIGQAHNAIVYLKDAEKYFDEIQDFDMLFLCILNIGILHFRIKNYYESIKYLLKSNKLLDKQKKLDRIKNIRKYDYNCYLSYANLGNTYTQLYDFEKAEFFTKKCHEQSVLNNNVDQILYAKNAMIQLYLHFEMLEPVEALFEDILSFKQLKNSKTYCSFLINKSRYQDRIGKREDAMETLKEALKYVKKYHEPNKAIYEETVNQGIELASDMGRSEDVIFFSKELQLINKTQKNETLHFSKIALKQFEEISELELEKKQINEILYIFGHDLKTPIRIAKNMVEILMEDPQEHRNLLPAINQNTGYALQLMDATLAYSQLSLKFDVFEEVSLTKIINELKQKHTANLVDRQVEIKQTELPVVSGNYVFLKQLFSNLIENAINYGVNKTNIYIQSRKENNFYVIEVKDNGPGIPEDELTSIFKLFKKSRLNTNKQAIGLGLAICKRIVEMHKGFIYAKSKIGKGTSFFVYLPSNKN